MFHIYFISAIRGEVRPIVEIGVGESKLGTHGEGLIEILSLILRRSEYEKISGKIIKWASKFVNAQYLVIQILSTKLEILNKL